VLYIPAHFIFALLLQSINILQAHWVTSMTEEQTHLKGQLILEDKIRTNSVASLSSSGVSDEVSLLPEVAFAPGSNNGGTIDSPRVNRENQPLLGRMESDVTFNNFPGIWENYNLNYNLGRFR
jgi:hypothetical protein